MPAITDGTTLSSGGRINEDASQFWTRPELAQSPNLTQDASGQSGPLTSVPESEPEQTFVSAARRALAAYRPSSLNVLRVSQLDAELLDAELTTVVKEQFLAIFSLFKPTLKEKYEPEFTALLQYLMCHLSIYSMGASYGLQLQNLKYRNEARHSGRLEVSAIDAPLSKWQKMAHALLYVGGRWGWIRVNRHATTHEWSAHPERDWRNRVWTYLQKAETVFRALSLVNFLVFLYNGRYRSLLDRLLRMRLVYTRREMARQVSFEFMNRQLVWHAFTEFLLFLVPLVNVERIKNTVIRAFSGPVTVDLPDHICAICHAKDAPKPVVHAPYRTNCGHIYCYYCIK
ncbi:hypothetical protein SpCBS45565_g00254 [Spizellomyces sp. 'palustris']|nr:hypothetical protein SpCBS45565_g00254 [Spizellomyces sp. 'palustris']